MSAARQTQTEHSDYDNESGSANASCYEKHLTGKPLAYVSQSDNLSQLLSGHFFLISFLHIKREPKN